MARIAGIQIEKDKKGRLAYVRINLKKHKSAIDFLHGIGAIDEGSFEKDWKEGITCDEMFDRVKPKIKKLFSK